MELDPRYADVIVRPLAAVHGKAAALEANGESSTVSRNSASSGSVNRPLPPGDRGYRDPARTGHPDLQGLCLALRIGRRS